MTAERFVRGVVLGGLSMVLALGGCILRADDDDGGPGATGTGAGTSDGGAGGGGADAGGCGQGYERPAGPIARTCAPPTDNECDGSADVNAALPNGPNGNGFDDDCDGLVDEGCLCPQGIFAGDIHDCWLVPATQIDMQTGKPVGWCLEHAGGTRKCIAGTGGSPDVWSGECRGAQKPSAVDFCVAGDFDCDGLEENAAEDCACFTPQVSCPVDPIVTKPYPDPTNLLEIDASSWILGGAGALATDWKWTVTGGDCDNILPHPSFAVYGQADSTSAEPIGSAQSGLGVEGAQRGFVVEGAEAESKLYPAFALSGDYLVTGEFVLDGQPHSCTVKVHVRAPGIRAEACWTPMPNDMDLHFARLQNSNACSGIGHGWFSTCDYDETGDDCYYNPSSGCRGFSTNPSTWGYAQSTDDACHGWGSRRDPDVGCDNPRLDFDNIYCDPSVTNPDAGFSDFCGAENINVDNPKNGDRFAVAVQAFNINDPIVQSHLNIYCNGERRLSLGYDPTGQSFPKAMTSGYDSQGDFWQAVVVEAVVDGAGELTDCIIKPIHSTVADPLLDGSTDFCVEEGPQGGATFGSDEWLFQPGGAYPSSADGMCWH